VIEARLSTGDARKTTKPIVPLIYALKIIRKNTNKN
jgi:hypothetical protein